MAVKSINDVRDTIYQEVPQYQPLALSNETLPSRDYWSSPAVWEDQILYFLLPDRFSRAGDTGQPVYTKDNEGNAVKHEQDAKDWRSAGKDWVGGTLEGVKSKLPYLKKLGVSALWVGPIFKQVKWLDTYHGYGVQDFLEVDAHFGTKESLKALVEAAHAEGIYVLLDIILNHSGNVFEYKYHDPAYTGETFDVKGFYASKDRPILSLGPVDDQHYPDGAVWPKELQNANCFTRKGHIRDPQGWNDPPEFLDGDFYDLKDIALGDNNVDNFQPTIALKTLCEAYKYWIAYADVDGYRIDTVKHMGDGPTRYFASVIHEYAQSLGKDKFLLIGECTDRAYDIVEVTGLDAALGIGNVQEKLWKTCDGEVNPEEYFNLFRNALYLNKGSKTWSRDKIVTMIDDHDQVWRSKDKGRFCSALNNKKLVASAIMLNLCTLGIPCIYYGTEQAFDGAGDGDFKDRYIREAMFGGAFGAFRSRGVHFFDENKDVYKAVSEVAEIREKQIALRRGAQYFRDISGDGVHFGPTRKVGDGRIQGIIAWSRLFADEEVVCAINTNADKPVEAYINVDSEIHRPGSRIGLLYPNDGGVLQVEERSKRSCIRVKINAGGFVILKGPWKAT